MCGNPAFALDEDAAAARGRVVRDGTVGEGEGANVGDAAAIDVSMLSEMVLPVRVSVPVL